MNYANNINYDNNNYYNSVLNNSNGSFYDSNYSNYWYTTDTSTSSIESNASPILNRQVTNTINKNNDNNNYFYNQSYANGNYNNTNYQPVSNQSSNQYYATHSSPIIQENKTQSYSCSNQFSTEILPLLEAITNGESSMRRRLRTAFTQEQRRHLLNIFQTQMYPSKELLEELSTKMNVTTTIVQVR